MQNPAQILKRYLVASDFDQTLSFHDSGCVLSEMVGIPGKEFEKKTAVLSVQNFVQQGAELSYLLLHDPDLHARVRKEHLIRAGKNIRLKMNIQQLRDLLGGAIEGYLFEFHVLSAAPQEVVESALEGVIAPDHVHGTQLRYDSSGRVEGIVRVNAGYGKVTTLDDLQTLLQIGADRVVYVGDGSSDGFTLAVSEARTIAQIARRTVLSDDALSVLVPILEEIAGWNRPRIRNFFEEQGLLIQGWDKVQADWLTFRSSAQSGGRARAGY